MFAYYNYCSVIIYYLSMNCETASKLFANCLNRPEAKRLEETKKRKVSPKIDQVKAKQSERK